MTWSQLKQLAISSCRRRPSDLNGPNMQFSIDVSILYAQDGVEWADYLQESVQTFLSPRIVNINCVKLGSGTTLLSPISRAIRSSKVLLIIVSQELLNFVRSVNFLEVGKLMDGARTLAMLCGIRADQLTEAHFAHLPASSSWKQMEARSQDKQFAFELISALCDQLKKVDETLTSGKPKFKLTPRKVIDANTKVFLLLEHPISGGQRVAVTLDTKEVPCKVRNAYTVQFVMPHAFLASSKLVHVQLLIDGECQGARPIKCESKLGELNSLLQGSVSPFENLRLTLGLPTVQEVDGALAKAFIENVPTEGFQFLTPSKLVEERRKSESNLPTLLHFAAQYGLKELASVLLKCPGALSCCQLLNIKGQSPATVATQAGHPEVASLIDEWMSSRSAINRLSTLSRATSIYQPKQGTPISSAECSQRNSAGSSGIPGYEHSDVHSGRSTCDAFDVGVDGLASGSEASTSQEQLPRAGSASDSGAHSDASDTETSNNRLSLPFTNPTFPDYDMLPRQSRPEPVIMHQKSMTLTRDARSSGFTSPASDQDDHVYYMYNGTKTTRKSGCQTLTREYDFKSTQLASTSTQRTCTSMSTLPSNAISGVQRASAGIYYDVPPPKPTSIRLQHTTSPPRMSSFKSSQTSPLSPSSKTSLAEVLAEYDFPVSPTSNTPAVSSPTQKHAASLTRAPSSLAKIPTRCSKGDYYDLPRFNYGNATVNPDALQIPEVPAPPPPSS